MRVTGVCAPTLTAVVATSLPAVVHVTLSGQPAASVTVSWVAPDGGSVSSTTDASGVATSTWTMGDTARVYTLTAAITGASVTTQATATPGPLAGLFKVTQDSLMVAAGASTLITVRAVDRAGNPVAGVPVSWTTTGGALTATTAGFPAVTFTILAQ